MSDTVDSSGRMLAADTARWRRAKDVFLGALACSDEERAAYVELACGADVELRDTVERMLAGHAGAGEFLEASPARLTGRRLAHYEVGPLIGAGGMGEVYAARDLDLQREVALKIGLSLGRDAALRREAQHASRLNHPHICTIYEVGAFEGRCYIAMEYVPGQRLSDIVPADGLPLDLVVRYGLQVADALAHAHREGVIHRDLKSANVVVTPEGRAKVLDFGLARRLPLGEPEAPGSISANGLVAGTLAYMSPEQLRGGSVDARSDIWALGVLLYEMAVGARPFAGATPFEMCAAILHESASPMPSRVPMPLQAIIARCLEKTPDDRYQRAEDLHAALASAPLDAARPLWPLSLMRRRRHVARRRLAIVAALVLVAIAGLVWRQRNAANLAPAATAVASRPAIAVMPFESLGAGADGGWLSKGVQSMLVTGLAQARGLHIVSMQRLYEATRQTGAVGLDSLSRAQAADVARRAGAGATVVGSVMRAGATIRIDAQVEDLASGRVLAATSVSGSDLFALTDQLAARIRDSVGVNDRGDVRPVAEVSSASLEAYRLYSLGLDAAANLRLEEAWPLLQQAVQIDPTFAEAYLQLALTSGAAGRPVDRSQYLRKAAENQQRLTERQRLLLQVELARADFRFDEAVRGLDRLLDQFPDLDAISTLAVQLHSPLVGPRPDLRRLLEVTQTVVRANPSSGLARNNRAYALVYAGRYREAVAELETYARLAPREPNPYDSLGDAYLMMGSPEQAIASYTRALSIDARFAHGGRAWALGVLGRYDEALMEPGVPAYMEAVLQASAGRYDAARQTIAKAVAPAEADGDRWRSSGLYFVAAMLAIEQRDFAAALAACQAADAYVMRLPPERQRIDRVLMALLRGVAEVRRGRLDAARSELTAQTELYRSSVPVERWWHDALAGEIALASGDLNAAARWFESGRPPSKIFVASLPQGSVLVNDLLLRDGSARVARARGDLRDSADRYRQLLRYGPDQVWVATLEPRYVLELARVLDQLGDRAAARLEYQRFLRLWNHADAGLPEVSEATRAIARLAA